MCRVGKSEKGQSDAASACKARADVQPDGKDTDYSVHSVRNMLGDKGSTEIFIRKVCEVYHVDERWFRREIGLDEAVESGFSPARKLDYAAVGQRLKDRRTEPDLSTAKLAENDGCSRVLITRAENGEGICTCLGECSKPNPSADLQAAAKRYIF